MKSRLQLAIGMVIVAALFVLGTVIWVDRMTPVTIVVDTPEPASIRVEVSGAVREPGVVEVPTGARLVEVVEAAGGFAENADTDQLNLAGRVGDGEQVLIPAVGEVAAAPGGEVPGGLVDINTASVGELDTLPGIGEVLAGRIIEYREANGPFTSVDQLTRIEGISQRMVDELAPLVTVSPGG